MLAAVMEPANDKDDDDDDGGGGDDGDNDGDDDGGDGDDDDGDPAQTSKFSWEAEHLRGRSPSKQQKYKIHDKNLLKI